ADLSLKRGGDALLSARLTVGLKCCLLPDDVKSIGQVLPLRPFENEKFDNLPSAQMPTRDPNRAIGADAPITVALHFVNVAQRPYVLRCVPQLPPTYGNVARLQRSDFAHRDQMRCVQVSNIRPRDPNIPVPSSNYAVLPARVIACPTIIRPYF